MENLPANCKEEQKHIIMKIATIIIILMLLTNIDIFYYTIILNDFV